MCQSYRVETNRRHFLAVIWNFKCSGKFVSVEKIVDTLAESVSFVANPVCYAKSNKFTPATDYTSPRQERCSQISTSSDK